MTKPLRIRLPEDLRVRLDRLSTHLAKQAGGVEQDFSKIVRHVLVKGLDRVEKEMVEHG